MHNSIQLMKNGILIVQVQTRQLMDLDGLHGSNYHQLHIIYVLNDRTKQVVLMVMPIWIQRICFVHISIETKMDFDI